MVSGSIGVEGRYGVGGKLRLRLSRLGWGFRQAIMKGGAGIVDRLVLVRACTLCTTLYTIVRNSRRYFLIWTSSRKPFPPP